MYLAEVAGIRRATTVMSTLLRSSGIGFRFRRQELDDQSALSSSFLACQQMNSRKPRLRDDTMRFGVFWPYSKTIIPSKLLSERNPSIVVLQNHIALATACEKAGMDFILIADGYATPSDAATRLGFQDPRTHAVLWALPILLATQNLGVISTVHTTYVHPVQMARFAGHLDCLSGGRWGWNIVNGFRDQEARLFGFDQLPEHDAAFDVSDEYVAVVKSLWAGAPIEHKGSNYKVVGQLAGPRPEVQPLFVNAALSPRGRRFAAEHCDYLFTSVPSEGWDAFWSLMQDAAEAAKKPEPPGVLVMGDLLLRSTPGAAQEQYDAIFSSMDDEVQTVWRAQTTVKGQRPPPKALALVGTPAEVAERICSFYHNDGLRGVLFRMPFWNVSELDEIDELFRLLRAAGVWKPPAEREHSW